LRNCSGVLRAEQTRFHISGTVVDSTGQPLEGVVAHYLVSRPISPTEVNYFGEAQQEVDGEFNIKTEAGLSAIVRFEKENYYPVERTFSAEELRDHAEIDIVAGKIPKRGKTKIQNIMVEMQKIGELTQLQRRSVTLRFSADGSGQIFDFGQPLDHARIGREVRVEDVTDPEQLPVKAAYVIADVDDDGKFLAKKVRYEDAIMNRRGQGWVPPNLRLVTMDSEGGFMLFISEDKVRGHDMAARKMAIAPEEEYEQVLELTPEIARRGHLFFFRMGGYYGRGKLDRPRLSADGTTFEIGVEFQIQTDGSRNLETMTWRH